MSEKQSPLVSVIIPVYNRFGMISKAIETIQNQTYRQWEIVISDNKSTDGTYEKSLDFAKNDPRIKVFQNTENLGPVKNWINGLKNATGEYIKFLWSDDWLDENYLEEMVKGLLENPKTIFAYSPAYLTDGINKKEAYNAFSGPTYIRAKKYFELNVVEKNFPLSPGCALFKKEACNLETILLDIPNGENLDFARYGAGTDLLMLLLPSIKYPNSDVYFSNKTFSYFYAHPDSFSCSKDLSQYYEYALVYALTLSKNQKLIRSRFIHYARCKAIGGTNSIKTESFLTNGKKTFFTGLMCRFEKLKVNVKRLIEKK